MGVGDNKQQRLTYEEAVNWLRRNSYLQFTLVREEHKGQKIVAIMAMKPYVIDPSSGKYITITNNQEYWQVDGRGGLKELVKGLEYSLNPPEPKKMDMKKAREIVKEKEERKKRDKKK